MSEHQWIKDFIEELSDLCNEYAVKILNPENGEYEFVIVDDSLEHPDDWWQARFDSKEHFNYKISIVTSSNDE